MAALAASGFPKEAISVTGPTRSADQFPRAERVDPAGAHTPGAAAAGGVIGGLLGGLAAVVGIAVTGGMGLFRGGSLARSDRHRRHGRRVRGSDASTRGFEPQIADFYDQALQKGQILVVAYNGAKAPVGRPRRGRWPAPARCRWPSARAGSAPVPLVI